MACEPILDLEHTAGILGAAASQVSAPDSGKKVWDRGILCFLAASSAWTSAVQAGISVSGEMAGAAVQPGIYDYTVRLQNLVQSTSPIKVFRFAATPGGGNYLPSAPLNIEAPPGWSYGVAHDSPTDGYSIQFQTSTALLNPGSSLDFEFEVPDSPAALRGDSPFYPGVPVGSSTVFGTTFGGVQTQFVVKSVDSLPNVPEPGVFGLFIVGAVGAFAAARRKRRAPPG